MKQIILILSALILCSCSITPERPQLYPNEIYKSQGEEAAQSQINECLKDANAYLATDEGKNLQSSLNTGRFSTSFGFGYGSRGTGIGVGVGTRPRYREDQLSGSEKVIRRFTEECLADKGYQIIGWSRSK